MSAYLRIALRLIILCVLVMAVVLVSNPPTAFACTQQQCEACALALDHCLANCHPFTQACVNACDAQAKECADACGGCQ